MQGQGYEAAYDAYLLAASLLSPDQREDAVRLAVKAADSFAVMSNLEG